MGKKHKMTSFPSGTSGSALFGVKLQTGPLVAIGQLRADQSLKILRDRSQSLSGWIATDVAQDGLSKMLSHISKLTLHLRQTLTATET